MKVEGVDNSRQALGGMVFDARVPASKQSAAQLGVMFGPEDRGEWRYDPGQRQIFALDRGNMPRNKLVMIPLVDRVTNQQLSFSNVIILYATYIEHLPTLHEIFDQQKYSGKRAVFFRDGVMLEGLWKDRGPNQPIQLFNHIVHPCALKPGPTWFIIVGQSSDLFAPKDGLWELEYHTQ